MLYCLHLSQENSSVKSWVFGCLSWCQFSSQALEFCFTGLCWRGIVLSTFFFCTYLNPGPQDSSPKPGFLLAAQDFQFWVISEMSQEQLMSQSGLARPASAPIYLPKIWMVSSSESDSRPPVLKDSFWSLLTLQNVNSWSLSPVSRPRAWQAWDLSLLLLCVSVPFLFPREVDQVCECCYIVLFIY